MLKKLRIYIYKHLGFSKSEANGLIFLIAFSILFFIVPALYLHYFTPKHKLPLPSKEIKEWAESLEKESDRGNTQLVHDKSSSNKTYTRSFTSSKKVHKERKLFVFNPNELSIDSLELLGFKSYITERIEKYKQSGGSFRNKKDLFSIYGIDSTTIVEIWDYIDLPEDASDYDHEKRLVKIDLNSATTSDLEKIRGIGQAFSVRIIKYGEMLGGYSNIEQLDEVYNLPDSTISLLKNSFYVDTHNLKQLNINTLPEDSLRKHPYISYKLASIIVNYRNQHGNYKNLDDLKNIRLLDTELFEKLSPYLQVGN